MGQAQRTAVEAEPEREPKPDPVHCWQWVGRNFTWMFMQQETWIMSTVSLPAGFVCASFVYKLNLHLKRCQYSWVVEVRGKVFIYLLPLSLQKPAFLAFNRAASLQFTHFSQAWAIFVSADRFFFPKVRGFPQRKERSLLAPFKRNLTSPPSFLPLTKGSLRPSQTI